MYPTYQKLRYTTGYGVRLNHTMGNSAEASTLRFPHYSTEFMLYYFIHGTGNIKIEGRNYDIQAGDMILLNPTEMFHCTIDSSKYHERFVLHIDNSVMQSFPDSCQDLLNIFYSRQKGYGNHISAQTAAENGLDTLVKSIYAHIQGKKAVNTAMVICKTVELLVQITTMLAHSSATTQPPAYENKLIHNVLLFLNAHYQEDISISSIAEAFHVDKSYLSHLFKDNVGTSVWNYVIFLRINHFNNLITQNHPIEEACHQAGFQNYSNFYRLYKKHMAMTPQQFKQQHKL